MTPRSFQTSDTITICAIRDANAAGNPDSCRNLSSIREQQYCIQRYSKTTPEELKKNLISDAVTYLINKNPSIELIKWMVVDPTGTYSSIADYLAQTTNKPHLITEYLYEDIAASQNSPLIKIKVSQELYFNEVSFTKECDAYRRCENGLIGGWYLAVRFPVNQEGVPKVVFRESVTK